MTQSYKDFITKEQQDRFDSFDLGDKVKKELEDIFCSLCCEAYASGRENGYDEGYEEGHTDGFAEGRADKGEQCFF